MWVIAGPAPSSRADGGREHQAAAPDAAASDQRRIRWTTVAALLLPLAMFGQVFSYIKQLMPLWALSKLFPVLALPLALLLLRSARPPATRQLLLTFAWLLLVPSIIAIWTFQQSFLIGLTAQVKLLPILFFFSFLALLRWWRPTMDEVTATFLVAGVITIVVLIALCVLAPQSWYIAPYDPDTAPMLTTDNRGNRIRMPMYFALIGIFYCYRRALAGDGWRWMVPAATGFALAVLVVRQRTTVIGLAGVAAINSFLLASGRVRLVLTALLPVALAALFSIPYLATVFDTSSTSGFDTRWITTVKAVDFLGLNPLAWLFGVGTISPLDRTGLMQYFNHFFFLADIAWLGVVFEFGVVGALLILAIPIRGLWLVRTARAGGDTPFLGALGDYLVFAIITSPLNPLTLAPGEVATIMAVAVYALDRRPARA
jgi:hypothetical protein